MLFALTYLFKEHKMLIHVASEMLSNPLSTLFALPVLSFLPAVGVLMIATAISDRSAA
jgi:hypothetical protein